MTGRVQRSRDGDRPWLFIADLVIGDDWKIAFAVALVMVVGIALVFAGVSHAVLSIACALLLFVAFTVALMVDARS